MHERERDPLILADKEKLSQVLFNLLSNAMKYVKRGGAVKVRLTTELSRTQQSSEVLSSDHSVSTPEGIVRITVTDTGRGIPMVDYTVTATLIFLK